MRSTRLVLGAEGGGPGGRVPDGRQAERSERSGLPFAARLVLGGAVALTLVVAAALFLFAHPMGDDLCNAVNVRELGLLEFSRKLYLEWGGRWGAHLALVGFPAIAETTRWYGIAVAATFVVTLLSIRLLLVTLLPPTRWRAWPETLVLLAVYWAGMPHPGETVYWFTGAVVYSLNISLALVLVACLLRLPAAPSRSRTAAIAALAAGAFVMGGFHELTGLMLVGVLTLGAAAGILLLRDERGWVWAIAAAAAGVGWLSVVVAPGNAMRGAAEPGGANLGDALAATLFMWIRVLDLPAAREPIGQLTPLGWVDARLLAASALLATMPALRRLYPAWFARAPQVWRFGFPLVTAGALTACFLLGGWALGRTLPLRVFNVLYLVFLMGWFLTVCAWSFGAGRGAAEGGTIRALRTASAVVLALGLLASPNVKYGLRDLVQGYATDFDRSMESRYARARALREGGGGELRFSSPEHWPASYFRNDVGDLSPPLRECVARYFGVGPIRLAAREIRP